MKRLFASASAAALLAISTHVAADAGPNIRPGWYLPIGVNIGGAAHANAMNGAVLGAEASIVKIGRENLTWWGAYTDALYDTSGFFRGSVGPELGFAIFGVDGGLAYQLGKGRADLGFVVRPLITFGVFAVYGRYGHMFNDTNAQDWTEFGVLLKFPVALDVEPTRRERPLPQRREEIPPLPPVPQYAPPPPAVSAAPPATGSAAPQ